MTGLKRWRNGFGFTRQYLRRGSPVHPEGAWPPPWRRSVRRSLRSWPRVFPPDPGYRAKPTADLDGGKLAAKLERTHNSGIMQAMDLFSNAGSKCFEAFKITFFRMLPRGAQIGKIRGEFNNGLLKQYGKITKLEIDKGNQTISLDLELKGEKECIQIKVASYRLHQAEGQNLFFEPGTIEVSREWLNTLLKTLVKTNVLPERIEIKDPFQLAVVKSLL